MRVPILCLCLLAPQAAFAHYNLRGTTNFDDRPLLQTTLSDLSSAHIDIDDLAAGPNGEWMIVADDIIYHSASTPASMVTKVQQYIDSGRTVDAIAFGPGGSWVVAADDWFFRSAGVPQGATLQDVVKGRQNAGKQIDEIVFTPGGGFVVLSEGYYYGLSVPSVLWAAIKDTDHSKRRPRRIAIGADGRSILLGEQWFASDGCNTTQRDHLKNWQRLERSIDHILLGIGGDYVFYSHNEPILQPASPLLDLEYALIDEGGLEKNIWQRLDELDVPGVTIAVIDGNQIRWARGYGELEADSDLWVRTSSPYSVASMSKYISALVAMRKVKDGTIAFGTDARVMADLGYGNMDFWEVLGSGTYYNTPLPYGLTLRRLLSHTAAMNNNETGDGWGGMIDGAEISTISILLGYGCDGACALDTKRIWHDPAKGNPPTDYDYSNSGFEVVRAMLEDLEGVQFEDIAQTEVLDPLGMADSTFEQPLPASFASRVAPPLDSNGDPMPYESYQWIAGGGLYASAKDYAKAMMVLIDQASTHASDYLDPAQTSEMLTDQRGGDSSRYGFGLELSSDGERFAHGGYIPNYSWAQMVGSHADGVGIVIITNATGNNGRRLVCDIERAFRDQFGYPLPSC